MKRRFALLLVAALALSPVMRADDEKAKPATQPTTQPTTKPASQAKVSPEARKILDEVKEAYAGLKSLELAGGITFDSDVAGKQRKEHDTFTAAFVSPNKFRHEMKGNMVAGSTGEKAYALSLEENTYVQK